MEQLQPHHSAWLSVGNHSPELCEFPYDLVVLDEITYMLAFDYLDEAQVIESIKERPKHQSVVMTGRGGGSGLQALADTVSEVKEVKHAFRAGIKARKGVDY